MNNEQTAPEAEIQSEAEIQTTELNKPEGEESEAATEQQESEESKRLRGVEKRIGRVLRKASDAAARADFYQQKYEESTRQQRAEDNDVPMTRADLESAFAQLQLEQSEKQKADRLNSKFEKAIESDPDFADALDSSDVIFSDDQLNVIKDTIDESNHGIELAKYLAKHPDEQERLSGLSPIQIARELGKLEIKAVAAAKPKQSNAPRPLESVKGSASASSPSPDDTAAWIRWRNEQQKRK